ncbi:MAG TPA: exodeoxyribonuclease VII small subunit [Lacunisphaera sp.]|nr:exodeoxyribonuclease VII small subunit [Lacunisphaera sp.]HQZ45245.1 exodeoxyribonuclease VII small subunit [Usitatibacteraceae bacterium]
MAKTTPNTEDIAFERALEELEALVARMEDGKLPLEESLAAYQRGAELLRHCEGKLSAAQARISVLEGEVLKDLPAAES